MCPFTVRVSKNWSLADFLGSLITFTFRLTRRLPLLSCFNSAGGFACPHLRLCISTPYSVRARKCHFSVSASHPWIVTESLPFLPSHSPDRIMLRTRLTLGRLTLPRKPWPFGEGASHPLYRYLYLHLLFHTLQQSSRFTFDAEWNAPLPIITDPIASVNCLMPDYYPRQTPRLVSCYALFK